MSMSYGDVSYSDMGICPICKEHCEFYVRDENGEPMDENDPDYAESESVSDCCGA